MSDEREELNEVQGAESNEAPVAEPTMEEIVRDPNAPVVSIKKLLEAGVHFGHRTKTWNPKMSKFIYGARNGIYIIDLVETATRTGEAYRKLKSIVEDGGKVLFVGTKTNVQQIIVDEATRSGSFYIAHRWLGGTLTNLRTILGRTKRLKDLEAMEADGSFEKLPKKEVAALKKELEKLAKNLEGIKEMRKLPQAVVVSDPTKEHYAVKEASRLGIPVFGICDTSDDPDGIAYPLPANNDGTQSLKLILGLMADAVVEAKGGIPEYAYGKLEGEDATMKDAIRAADIANEQRKAAIRQQRKEREERFARLQAERAARYQAAKQAKEGAPAPEAKETSEGEGK